jgi:hypothetical protein
MTLGCISDPIKPSIKFLDKSHDLYKFQLDFRPHKIYFFELNIKFYITSSSKTLKLVNFSGESEKGAKNSYGSYPTEFVFAVKYEN